MSKALWAIYQWMKPTEEGVKGGLPLPKPGNRMSFSIVFFFFLLGWGLRVCLRADGYPEVNDMGKGLFGLLACRSFFPG